MKLRMLGIVLVLALVATAAEAQASHVSEPGHQQLARRHRK